MAITRLEIDLKHRMRALQNRLITLFNMVHFIIDYLMKMGVLNAEFYFL